MYIWTEGSWTKGVVASEERTISFKYLTEHSETGITVTTGVMPVKAEQALVVGTSEPQNSFHTFLLTCPSSGLWKRYADGSWINHS